VRIFLCEQLVLIGREKNDLNNKVASSTRDLQSLLQTREKFEAYIS